MQSREESRRLALMRKQIFPMANYAEGKYFSAVESFIQHDNLPALLEHFSQLNGGNKSCQNFCWSVRILPSLMAIENWGSFQETPQEIMKIWPNICKEYACTALILCAKYDSKCIAEYILEVEPSVEINFGDIPAISHAIFYNANQVLKLLLQKKDRIDINKGLLPPLHVACFKGHQDIVESLIDFECDLQLSRDCKYLDGDGWDMINYRIRLEPPLFYALDTPHKNEKNVGGILIMRDFNVLRSYFFDAPVRMLIILLTTPDLANAVFAILTEENYKKLFYLISKDDKNLVAALISFIIKYPALKSATDILSNESIFEKPALIDFIQAADVPKLFENDEISLEQFFTHANALQLSALFTLSRLVKPISSIIESIFSSVLISDDYTSLFRLVDKNSKAFNKIVAQRALKYPELITALNSMRPTFKVENEPTLEVLTGPIDSDHSWSNARSTGKVYKRDSALLRKLLVSHDKQSFQSALYYIDKYPALLDISWYISGCYHYSPEVFNEYCSQPATEIFPERDLPGELIKRNRLINSHDINIPLRVLKRYDIFEEWARLDKSWANLNILRYIEQYPTLYQLSDVIKQETFYLERFSLGGLTRQYSSLLAYLISRKSNIIDQAIANYFNEYPCLLIAIDAQGKLILNQATPSQIDVYFKQLDADLPMRFLQAHSSRLFVLSVISNTAFFDNRMVPYINEWPEALKWLQHSANTILFLLVRRNSYFFDQRIVSLINAWPELLMSQDKDGHEILNAVTPKQRDFYLSQCKELPLNILAANDYALWFHMIQSVDIFDEKVSKLIQKYANILVFCTDKIGRVAIDIASKKIKYEMQLLFLIHGRYRLSKNTPDHVSRTCFVNEAIDEHFQTADGTITPRKVALKIMKNANQFAKEIHMRDTYQLSDLNVVPVLSWYVPLALQTQSSSLTIQDIALLPDVDDASFNEANISAAGSVCLTKELVEQFYIVVLPYAERNMYVSMKQEYFAGRQFDEVAYTFKRIATCVQEMHEKGLIHGDIKPLNLVRIDGVWKLIDLDATVRIGDKALSKYSSAYIPPESLNYHGLGNNDDTLSTIIPKISIKSHGGDGDNNDELIAHPTFDVWALGCLLYQLCHPDVLPLFPSASRDDNLNQMDLHQLFQWDNYIKQQLLFQITNMKARNLLAMILTKEVNKRPSISRILAHPFLSGKSVIRMAGEEASYDCFISYRVATDQNHALQIFDLLNSSGLKVWLDVKCLKPGEDWEQGFCSGLVNSRTFICLLSRGALQNFGTLTPDSRQDNVLLEYRMALELLELNYINKVLPVMIGDLDVLTGQYGNFFKGGCLPNLPDIEVREVEGKILHHMETQCLGIPIKTNQTVKAVVTTILKYQGSKIEGHKDSAFQKCYEDICNMMKSDSNLNTEVFTTSQSVTSAKDNLIQMYPSTSSAQTTLQLTSQQQHQQFQLSALAQVSERLQNLERQFTIQQEEMISIKAKLNLF